MPIVAICILFDSLPMGVSRIHASSTLVSKSHLKYMSLPLHDSIFFYTQLFQQKWAVRRVVRRRRLYRRFVRRTARRAELAAEPHIFLFPFRVARGEQFLLFPFFPTTSHRHGRRPGPPPLHLDLFPHSNLPKTHSFEDRAVWRLFTEGIFVLRAALGDLPLGPPLLVSS